MAKKNSQRIILRIIQKHTELNENENTTYQHLCNVAKGI